MAFYYPLTPWYYESTNALTTVEPEEIPTTLMEYNGIPRIAATLSANELAPSFE